MIAHVVCPMSSSVVTVGGGGGICSCLPSFPSALQYFSHELQSSTVTAGRMTAHYRATNPDVTDTCVGGVGTSGLHLLCRQCHGRRGVRGYASQSWVGPTAHAHRAVLLHLLRPGHRARKSAGRIREHFLAMSWKLWRTPLGTSVQAWGAGRVPGKLLPSRMDTA